MGQPKPPRTGRMPKVSAEDWKIVAAVVTGHASAGMYRPSRGHNHFIVCDMCQGVSDGDRCDYCGRPLQ